MGLGDRARELYRSVNRWLDADSHFYSRIAEFEVTRRTAIRVNLVTVAMVTLGIAVESHLEVALAAALSAAWLMYRAMWNNDEEKKGGRR